MGMTRKLTILIAVLALALGACGDDDTDVTTPGAGGDAPMAEAVCIGDNEELLPEYVGLSLDEATTRAEDQGYSVRVVGEDGECYAITMDLRDDRVNLELVDDVVVAAAIF
jgi:hypothetical protein